MGGAGGGSLRSPPRGASGDTVAIRRKEPKVPWTAWGFLALPPPPTETTPSVSASTSLCLGLRYSSVLSSHTPPLASCPSDILSLPGFIFLTLSQSQTFPGKAYVSPGNLCPTASLPHPWKVSGYHRPHTRTANAIVFWFFVLFYRRRNQGSEKLCILPQRVSARAM